MSKSWIETYKTFKKAHSKLKEFIETDNGSEKDRGAIINAFQYTFELWWKTMQKYMQEQELLEELGPAATMRGAFHYQFIDDGDSYMTMLKDRNLITHTYKENVASDIYVNIKERYVELLEEFIQEYDQKI